LKRAKGPCTFGGSSGGSSDDFESRVRYFVKDGLVDSAVVSMLGLLTANGSFRDRNMQDESLASPTPEPLRAVADAMDSVVKGAKEGADHAIAAATDAAPAAAQFVSQAVYKTCYSVSFCAVVPVVLLARLIPSDNAGVHGLIDGAHAAIDYVDQMQSRWASR
jgi:hypothetical protein